MMACVLRWMVLAAVLLTPATGLDTEVVVLRAVRGREARLPCGQGRVFLDGPDAHVMWLKNDRDLLYRADRIFSSNCDGEGCHDETALTIKRVSEQDGGMYRCRVHYQASPSVDYVIDVRLVDPPGMPRVYLPDGEEVTKGFVGPLSLGADLTLTCEVVDANPDTLVYWRRGGRVEARARPAAGVLRAALRVPNVTRAERDARAECVAQNADVSEPTVAAVVLRIYLPPLSVEIRLNNNVDFEAGQPRVVDCVVVGCVPPPSITWHLGDTMLRPSVHKELHDGNYTVSSLTLAPSLRDDGRDLVCRAHNAHLPDRVFEDRVKLNIGYRPVCVESRAETVGAVPREAESVTCTVDAWPEPMQFSWTFPDTRTLYTSVKSVPGHRTRFTSTLTWVPRAADSGRVLCRAANALGEQRRACAAAVAPGGPPRAPECATRRARPDALRVDCEKGWDGGRPQTIHLELLDADGALLQNMSDPGGRFLVSAPDRNLTARVYASSVRGRSAPYAVRLWGAAPVAAEVVEDISQPWSGWAQSAAGAAALVALAAMLTLCVRARRARREFNDPDLVPRSDGSFHREPDFTREERVLGTTNITVNQLASCPSASYSASPAPCRVLVGCAASPDCGQQSYYV